MKKSSVAGDLWWGVHPVGPLLHPHVFKIEVVGDKIIVSLAFMCISYAWTLWKRSLPTCFHQRLFWQRWFVESFAKAQDFFQGLVWCQRTSQGFSAELLGTFTFIAAFLQLCVFPLADLIRFSRLSQAGRTRRRPHNSAPPERALFRSVSFQEFLEFLF